MIHMDNMNTTYQDIITLFVLKTMLQHVVMLWIIETNEQLKYDMDRHNQYWMTGGPWYNTSICEKYMEICLKDLLEIQELKHVISCVLLMHMQIIILQNMMI